MAIPEGKSILIDFEQLSLDGWVLFEEIQEAGSARPSPRVLRDFLIEALAPAGWEPREVGKLTYGEMGKIFEAFQAQHEAIVPNASGSA